MSSSREVSAMIKHGFISDPTLTVSPSRTNLSPSSSSSSSSRAPSSNKTHVQPPASPPQASQTRPTLFQMMSEEQSHEPARASHQSNVSKIITEFEGLVGANTGSLGGGDVRVTVVGKDGITKVCIDVHKRVLLEKSGFFREKLKGGGTGKEKGFVVKHSVEISECDDVEVYLEALVLMYCDDLRIRLVGEGVSKVLALLKVCAAIMFNEGIISCLEYLEAVPWSDDEEEKILSNIDQLHLHDSAAQVLQRVSSDLHASRWADDIFLKLLTGVLEAKDDRARREMRKMISRLFREDSSDHGLNVSKDALYNACHRCVSSLVLRLSEATCVGDGDRSLLMCDIAREAENLQWLVDILTERKMSDDFVKLWADQKELAELHSKIQIMYRHEISKITAQLCIAIGRGQILVPREARFSLLSTWLEALYEDFGWMRACRTVDKKLIEDGLCKTILTLPLRQQQALLLTWFDRFLDKGDDCPNIRRAFEVWWRRAFTRQYATHQGNSQLQITVCEYPNR